MVRVKLTVKAAETIIGGPLGTVGKMPCRTYGLPAAECKVGSELRKIPGTPCAPDPANNYDGCYAYMRNQYRGGTIVAQYRRLDTIGTPQWIEAMVFLIGRHSPYFFRWHDSGDLSSVDHLDAICQIARKLPATKFWLPTQERKTVAKWRKTYGAIPPNLCIRLSSVKIGMYVGSYGNDPELCGSMIVRNDGETKDGVWDCPSRNQGNKCGDCRACWDRNVKMIAYHAH